MNIHELLWNNVDQRLTPELIVGILAGANAPVEPVDNSIVHTLPEVVANSSYGAYSFSVEPILSCFDELTAQHKSQWDEVEQVRQVFNPDYDAIIRSEYAGSRVQFVVRKDGVMVGNCGCYIMRSLHTQQLKASEDTMYIARDHRKGMLAVRFFKFCESVLLHLGVKEISVTTKVSNNVHKLWERQGYEFSDRVLSKVFEE